jgi:hypothetical protein
MEFITVDDVNDAVLQISEEDVVAANAYVNSLAKKFRVTDDSKLLNPPVYTIKRIAICYACYVRAMNSIGTDATVVFEGSGGGEGRDINAQKAKFYRQELDSLVNNLTTSAFTGEEVSGSVTINVFRA